MTLFACGFNRIFLSSDLDYRFFCVINVYIYIFSRMYWTLNQQNQIKIEYVESKAKKSLTIFRQFFFFSFPFSVSFSSKAMSWFIILFKTSKRIFRCFYLLFFRSFFCAPLVHTLFDFTDFLQFFPFFFIFFFPLCWKLVSLFESILTVFKNLFVTPLTAGAYRRIQRKRNPTCFIIFICILVA